MNKKLNDFIAAYPEIQLYPTWVPVEIYFNGKKKFCRPIDIRNGKNASPSNPDSWTTYSKATDYMGNNHGIDLLGLALTSQEA